MTICSACGHGLTPDGPCGFASVTVGEKTTWLCHADDHSCYVDWQGVSDDAVRDLAAPSNGSVSSRPSPGADPRLAALRSVSNPVTREAILAAADAADRAVGIVRVDTRDEAVQRAVYEHIAARYTVDIRLDTILRNHIRLVFAALEKLRGGQP